MTKYERAIYQIVTSSRDHLNAAEIYKRLKSSMPQIVLATVYNNLNKLTDGGLSAKFPPTVCPTDTTRFISTTIWYATSAAK